MLGYHGYYTHYIHWASKFVTSANIGNKAAYHIVGDRSRNSKFSTQHQALADFIAKQDKANKLAKLISSMVDTQDNVSWALLNVVQLCSCFAAAFICTGGQF